MPLPLLRTVTAGLIIFTLSGFTSLEALFAPKAELWPKWQAHTPGSTETVDHGAWRIFLQRYLKPGTDGVNRIDYAGVSAADARALHAYLNRLRRVPVGQLDRPEQLAYWINFYNAITVKVVVDQIRQKGPVDSIRDIDLSSGLFSDGPWERKLLEVAGEPVSLNDIEHRILRPIWKDPRIHYAVNCASIGCPNLAAEPYRGAAIEAQLDAAAKAYVNHPRGVAINGNQLIASKIYTWFADDFGGNEAAVIEHLKRYADPDLKKVLGGFDAIDGYDYDWGLNEAASR